MKQKMERSKVQMAQKIKRATIKDFLPLTNGLWAAINYDFPEEFNIESSQLDIIFLSNWSNRLAAPILNVIHDESSESSKLSTEELALLADMLNGMYKHKWDKLMAAAISEYDPIHNYSDDFEEHINYGEEVSNTKSSSGTTSNTRTDNLTDTKTDSRQIAETRNLTNSGSNSTDNDVYAFNSATAVGDTESSGTHSDSESGTVTTNHSGAITETNTGTQTNSGSNSNSESGSNETMGEKTRTYTKIGNIGNISTQKLLNEEIDLWQYNFLYEMMRDVINFISLPIYETNNF